MPKWIVIVIIVVTAIVSMVVLSFVASYKAYVGPERDFTNKPIYTYSKWLRFEGAITQGYEVHLDTTYRTYTDDCRVLSGESHIFGFIMKPIFSYIVEGYDGKEAVLHHDSFEAKIDDMAYSIRYPKSFMKDGCKFILDAGTLIVQEKNQMQKSAFKKEVLSYKTVNYSVKGRDNTLNADLSCDTSTGSGYKDRICERMDKTYDSYYYYFRSRDYTEKNIFHVNINVRENNESQSIMR